MAYLCHNSESTADTPAFLTMNEAEVDAFRPSLENAAAVLCNLAGVDHLKRSVLHEALLPSVINTVIRSVATLSANQETEWSVSNSPVPYNQLLFRNAVAVVRLVRYGNIRSNLQLTRVELICKPNVYTKYP